MSTPHLDLTAVEGRFARLDAIAWWDRGRVEQARVLVIGVGALGNEVVKNLCLLGIGHIVVVDRDRVELSNLSRSVLFRESDEGRPKAECAASAARGLFPEASVVPLVANVVSGVGLGLFRWADVVIGALDNREARVFVNGACARVGRPWIDGGIEVLQGIVRGFGPPGTACYECTMSRVDWELIEQRRSCALLARRAAQERGTPTTPTTASVIGGIQAMESVKLLHGLEALLGAGFVFEGLTHSSYRVQYAVKPDCPWHDPAGPIASAENLSLESTMREVIDWASPRLGGADAVDLGREILAGLTCGRCGTDEQVRLPLEEVDEARIPCAQCAEPRVPEFVHSIDTSSGWLDLTAREIGLPAWDVVWVRHGAEQLGVELAGDRDSVLGPVGEAPGLQRVDPTPSPTERH